MAEVKATAHMLHSHHIHHVSGVVRQGLGSLLLPVCMDKSVIAVQAHHATPVPDGPELIVVQIPPHVTQCAAVGVRGDYRALRGFQQVPEALVPQVGYVRHHAQTLHPSHCLTAQVRQSRVRRPGPGGQGVGLIPGQHGGADPGGCQTMQTRQVLAQGHEALHPQKGIEATGGPGLRRFRSGANQPHRRALMKFLLCAGEHHLQPLWRRGGVSPSGIPPEGLSLAGAAPQRQHQPLHPAPAQPGQMMPLQHMGLPYQTAVCHIVKKVRMGVQYHGHSSCSAPFYAVSFLSTRFFQVGKIFLVSPQFPLDFSPGFL